MKVCDILTPHAEVIQPDASVCEAAQKMQARDIGMLPVSDGDRLIGALTDRDIVIRSVAKGYDPVNTPVREIMTPHISCCFEDDNIQEAARIMEEEQIRRLPVLDSAKRLVGIISLGDLATRTHDEQLLEEVMEHVCERL
jgi:CBS domain-containing protein